MHRVVQRCTDENKNLLNRTGTQLFGLGGISKIKTYPVGKIAEKAVCRRYF